MIRVGSGFLAIGEVLLSQRRPPKGKYWESAVFRLTLIAWEDTSIASAMFTVEVIPHGSAQAFGHV